MRKRQLMYFTKLVDDQTFHVHKETVTTNMTNVQVIQNFNESFTFQDLGYKKFV